MMASRRYMSSSRVGFIGLGNMGFHMASNLAKRGHTLVLQDISPQQVQRFKDTVSSTAIAATSPKQVMELSDVVVTMLPSSPHVKQVYTDPQHGLFAADVTKSVLLIDSSTIDPAVSRSVIQKAHEKGHKMVDAPVSGGVGGAEKATLTFMVGGEAVHFQAAKPFLEAMGKNIVHCGLPGTGQVAKIANNLVLAVSMIGVSEGMNLGVKQGIDPKVLAGIINSSSGRCWSSDTYNPCPGVMEGVPSSRGYTGGFGSALMKKDLGLAVQAASDVQASIPMAALAHQIYTLLAESGAATKDFSFVYEFLKGNK
jgi:3-hydroxyisobutyrate dehydrogenase